MASDAELFDITVPDAERTLGGVKDDIEPDHPSVIVHMGKCSLAAFDVPDALETFSLLCIRSILG